MSKEKKLASPYPQPDRITIRLREVTDILFAPVSNNVSSDEKAKVEQAAADFTQAATKILSLVDGRQKKHRSNAIIDAALRVAEKYTDDAGRIELQAELDALEQEQLIDHLLVACLACQSQPHTSYESIERERSEIVKTRALIARNEKDKHSKKIDVLVSHHARRLWRENAKRRGTASGTTNAITAAVNSDLRAEGLKSLGKEAIRKRVQKIID